MRQVKLFKGVEMMLSDLEAEVNDWIREHQIRVHRISGNVAPQASVEKGQSLMSGSDVLMIVEYEVD